MASISYKIREKAQFNQYGKEYRRHPFSLSLFFFLPSLYRLHSSHCELLNQVASKLNPYRGFLQKAPPILLK